MPKDSNSDQKKSPSVAQINNQMIDFRSEISKSIEQVEAWQKRADERKKCIEALLNDTPTEENSPKLTQQP